MTDYDSDGCKDETEDLDDDNDGVNDVDNNSQALDMCQRGELGWIQIALLIMMEMDVAIMLRTMIMIMMM